MVFATGTQRVFASNNLDHDDQATEGLISKGPSKFSKTGEKRGLKHQNSKHGSPSRHPTRWKLVPLFFSKSRYCLCRTNIDAKRLNAAMQNFKITS